MNIVDGITVNLSPATEMDAWTKMKVIDHDGKILDFLYDGQPFIHYDMQDNIKKLFDNR